MTTRRFLSGNSDKSIVILSTTSATTIAERQRGRVYQTLRVANVTGSAATIDVSINDGTTDYYQVKGHSVAANATFDLDMLGVALAEGETIKATAGTGNALHLTLVFDDAAARERL